MVGLLLALDLMLEALALEDETAFWDEEANVAVKMEEGVGFEEASFWIEVTTFGVAVEVDLTLDLAVVVSSSQSSSAGHVGSLLSLILVLVALMLEETTEDVIETCLPTTVTNVWTSSQNSSSVTMVDLRVALLVNVLFGTEELVLVFLIVEVLWDEVMLFEVEELEDVIFELEELVEIDVNLEVDVEVDSVVGWV
jgi:hypothetical protein